MNIFLTAIEQVKSGFNFLEGPVWNKEGYLLFSDIPANRIYRWDENSQFSIYREPSGHSNGLTWSPDGCLIACEHGNRRVSRTLPDGEIVPLASHYQNHRLNSPNDCVVRSDGYIVFTDPPYGIQENEKEIPFHGIYGINTDHSLALLRDDFDRPNGLAFSPDESMIYIADTSQEHICQFNMDQRGNLLNPQTFAQVGRPDGMKVDIMGNLYVASTEGLVVFDPEGKRIAQRDLPERPSNCAFGDPDFQTLFITARTSLYKVRVSLPGISPWNRLNMQS